MAIGDEQLDLQNLMKDGDIAEQVAIEEGVIAENDREALVPCDETPGLHKKVDLFKMAMFHVQGYGNKALAKEFDVSPSHITALKGSQKFKNMLAALNAEIVSTARTFMTAASFKAVKTLIKCMDSHDERTKLKAATEVLDRIGLNAPEQIELIQKGDKIKEMDETQLLDLVKLGMKELMPSIKGAKHGDEHDADQGG